MSTFDAVRRSPSDSGGSDSDRHALIEQLLLAGLDHYFSGRYEQAIHVWTRVFFLDRGHARARAYIERARSALAERQREAEAQGAEEALRAAHASAAASYSTISTSLARNSVELSHALEGPPPRRFTRRDLLRRPTDPEPSAAVPAEPLTPPVLVPALVPSPHTYALPAALPLSSPASSAAPHTNGRLIAHVLLISLAVILLFGAGYVVVDRDRLATWWRGPLDAPVTSAPPSIATEPLPAPRAAEQTLARARTLFANGHLQEAARALSTIRPDDALRSEADRLTIEIQRAMLDAAGLAAASDSRRPAAPLAER